MEKGGKRWANVTIVWCAYLELVNNILNMSFLISTFQTVKYSKYILRTQQICVFSSRVFVCYVLFSDQAQIISQYSKGQKSLRICGRYSTSSFIT